MLPEYVREDLKGKIKEMGESVIKMMDLNLEGLKEKKVDYEKELMELERKVDKLEEELDNTCIRVLALYHPKASELRSVIAFLRASNKLERIADHNVNIFQDLSIFLRNPKDIHNPLFPVLILMLSKAKEMVSKVVDSLLNMDIDLAKEVIKTDDELDELNNNVYVESVDFVIKHKEYTMDYINLFFVSRNIEKIGDLATYIAEFTIFSVTGEDIRHHIKELFSVRRTGKVLVELSVVPIPVNTPTPSLSKYVAKAIDIIKQSGIKYQLTPMGTILEGDIREIFELINKIHENLLSQETPRLVTYIKIDERVDKEMEMGKKVQSVIEKLQES